MALVHRVSYSLEDYSGDRRTVAAYVPATATLTEVQSFSNAFAAELDSVTGMKILGATVALALTLPVGLKANAVASVDAERGINWSFVAANTVYSHTIRTPGALDANVDGEDVIDSGGGETTDFITVMLNGDAVTAPTDEYGNDLTAQKSQRVTFHK